jgi:hypothetical protein
MNTRGSGHSAPLHLAPAPVAEGQTMVFNGSDMNIDHNPVFDFSQIQRDAASLPERPPTQVRHDAAEATHQQPEGARQRGGGGAGEESPQLPYRRQEQEETDTAGETQIWEI